MKKSLLPIFFPMYCRGYREWTGEEEAGDGSLSPPSVSPPSPVSSFNKYCHADRPHGTLEKTADRPDADVHRQFF